MKAFAKLQRLAQQRGAKLILEREPYNGHWSVSWEREILSGVGGIVEVDKELIRRDDKDFGCACARVLDALSFDRSWDE